MSGSGVGGPNSPQGVAAFLRAAERITLPTDPREFPHHIAELQSSLETAAREFCEQTFEGSAADGGVTATVTSYGAVSSIRIGILAKREIDNFTLGDAVVEAVGDAKAKARRMWAERMASITLFGMPVGGLMPSPFDAPGPGE